MLCIIVTDFCVLLLLILVHCCYRFLCTQFTIFCALVVSVYKWWNVVLKADIVMILSSTVSCLLSVKYGAEHAMEISRYFSFAFLGNPKSTEQWVQIPLSALNVFEVCYWFFMSKLLSVQTGRGYWASFRFIMGSYGTGYLFYIVFVMFLVLYLI